MNGPFTDECHSQASTDHNVPHAFIQGQFKGIRVTFVYTFRTRMLWTVWLSPHSGIALQDIYSDHCKSGPKCEFFFTWSSWCIWKIQKGCPHIRVLRGSLGAPKKAHWEKTFQKSVFKRGVKTIGNYLICLDPKSCRTKFFFKNFEFFWVGTPKFDWKNFWKKVFWKGGQINWKWSNLPRSKVL